MEELVALVQRLNHDIVREIPKINHGGCGVFAASMYRQLEKLGYKPNIVILTSGWEVKLDRKKEILNAVMNNKRVQDEKLHTSFAHCCLEVGGLYFDGEMLGLDFLANWKERYRISGNYTIEELELSLRVGSWNHTYNRRKKNPTLSKIIRKAVKQVFHVEQKRYNYSL